MEETRSRLRRALASRRATDHLISLGHRRIAHISHASLDYVSALRRSQGYRARSSARRPPLRALARDAGRFQLRKRLPRHEGACSTNIRASTALFAGNDTVAIGAMLAVREAGLAIPGDIAVVGYDDVPTAAFACPPLTTMRTHAYEHGKLFAEAAIRLMKQDKRSVANRTPFPSSSSSATPAGAKTPATLRDLSISATASSLQDPANTPADTTPKRKFPEKLLTPS